MKNAATTPLLKLAHDLATDASLLNRFIATEPNGPLRLAFLAEYGIRCCDIAAVQLAEHDDLELFMRHLGEEIRHRFRDFIGVAGDPDDTTVAWPGTPIVLESVQPATISADELTKIVATGYFFGNERSNVKLKVGFGPSFTATAVREQGHCGCSTATFMVRANATGTFDVSVVRMDNGATYQSEIPSGLKVK